ncbi:MAG: hypothetical protein HOW73_31395 [Polyangiaceae bacterium]|nr:hypothetical protein [Polyangiaceae bacterium]
MSRRYFAVVFLLGCASPSREDATTPAESDTTAAVGNAEPAQSNQSPLASASAPIATVDASISNSASATASSSVDAPLPAESVAEVPEIPLDLTPERARGKCTDRATLRTAKGEVSCYPYRCRAGKCLLSCSSRKDCAGSDGPGDLAENGWPLDCHGTSCVPLPPSHVHP